MMIQNNRFLPPSPLPHSLLPRGRRQGRYVPFSANHTNGTTYDFLGQLIAAGYSNTGLTDESYSYDSNGNRITANGSNYTTGSNNELTSDGSWTYTYDDEGNRVSKTNSTHRELYEWDYRNRLTKVTQQEYNSSTEEWQDVQIVEYTYDYNNIWIRKLLDTNGDGTPDSKSIFIPENYQTTVQIDDGIVTHHYLWTPNQQDKLLADTTTSGILWALTDHLGTIRDVLDGNSSTHLIYDAFGNLVSGTNPLLFGYTGKAFDTATNLQNNINRWYDATTGRWLSTDPIGFEGNDANLYRYVGNNVPIYIDPIGLADSIISKTLISEESRTLKKIMAIGIKKVLSSGSLNPSNPQNGLVMCLKCGVVIEITNRKTFKIVYIDSKGCRRQKVVNETIQEYKPTNHTKEINIDFAKLKDQIDVGSFSFFNVSIFNFVGIYTKDLHRFATERDHIRANQICTEKSGLKKYLRD